MEDTSSRQYRTRSSVYDEQEQKIRDMQRDVLSVLTSSMSFTQTGNYLCRLKNETCTAPGSSLSPRKAASPVRL